MTFHFKTQAFARRLSRGGAVGMLALAAASLSGCGGVGGSTDAARVRAVDVAVNAGKANILVNNASANGDQQAFTTTAVSPYLYISGNQTSSFSYNVSVALPVGLLTPVVPSLTLNNNQFYSIFLVGRADVVPVTVPGTKTVNDPRFLQVLVTQDNHDTPGSGSALVRVVDAAPDGGTVDVSVDGTTLGGYAGLSFQEPTASFLNAPYVNVPAGNLSVQVNKTGTTTPLFAPISVPVLAGKTYTLVITQPTIAPTFGLQIIADNG